MMKIVKTDAIILYTQDIYESDRLITFFSHKKGKLKGIAKGARRSKKRFPNTLQTLFRVQLEFREKSSSSLVFLTCGNLLEDYWRICSDLKRLYYAYYFGELVLKGCKECQPNTGLYHLLKSSLGSVNSGSMDLSLLARIFELKYLSLLGYEPYITGCVSCKGILTSSDTVGFCYSKGGAICPRCESRFPSDISLSRGSLKALLMMQRSELRSVNRIRISSGMNREMERLLAGFITYHMGIKLNSHRFIENA